MFKTALAYDNWKNKYRYGEETPEETFYRVAKALASVEKDPDYWTDIFYKTLVKFDTDGKAVGLKCTPGGRITANAGTDFKHATLLNCYIAGAVSDAEIRYPRKTFDDKYSHDIVYKSDKNPDDLINIFLTILEQAKTLASEGGYGINFDFIRPRGSLIKGTGIKHPGVVSYMKIWDSVSECIVKGANDGYIDKIKNYLNEEDFNDAKETVKVMTRKGAMMAVLSCDHPDIEEFIRAKQSSGALTKFNISVLINDEFMEAVKKDKLYDLSFAGKVYKRVKARELYNLIMESTYNRAEPGVLFVDNMHRNNPLSYLGKANCCNPCCRKGTLVSTAEGLKKVENIKKGELIQTSLGFEPVENIEIHENHDVYRVNFSDGFSIDVTEGHIFHTQKVGEEARKKWDKEVRLSELNIEDGVFVRKSPYKFTLNNKTESFTRDLGLFAGLFLGDGHIDANDKVCISTDKTEDSSYIQSLCQRLGFSCWFDDSKECNSRKIVIGGSGNNKSIDVLKSLDLDVSLKAFEKTFPYEWLNTNKEFLGGLLDGLISSDGNVNDKAKYPQIRIKSCSKSLHEMIKNLMLLFAADYKLYPAAKTGEKRVILGREVERKHDCFEGVIDNDSILNVFSSIGFISHPTKNFALRGIVKSTSLNGVKWKTKIKNVELIGKDTVYDLYAKESDDWNTCGIVSRGCGEIPGLATLTTTCLLGSLNITQYISAYDKDNGSKLKSPVFDWEQYESDIKVFTRMLDNVNDVTYNSLPSYDWATKNIRQFGMGLNGLGSALSMLGMPYNSNKASRFVKKLVSIKENLTWQVSALLAKEKGTFPAYEKERFESTEYFNSDRITDETRDLLRKYGARNGKTTTNPPLGNCLEEKTSIQTDLGNISLKDIFKINGVDTKKSKNDKWYIPSKEIKAKTLNGYKRITGLYLKGEADTIKINASNKKVEGTKDHKLLVLVEPNKAKWVRLGDIKIGDKIISVQNHQ